ncbi:hypothetical protein, partial [Streptomyces sp. NPDC002851]
IYQIVLNGQPPNVSYVFVDGRMPRGLLRRHDAPPLRGGRDAALRAADSGSAGIPANSVGRGSNCSAIRPDGIRSANS